MKRSQRIVIRDATIIDGSGQDAYRGDIAIVGSRIASIAATGSIDATDAEIIDAQQRVTTPGFIDMHAHSDLQILTGTHEAKISQGITLEVLGQDGLSYAPIDEATLEVLRVRIKGWNGEPPDSTWSWRSVRDYLEHLRGRIPVNVAYLAPHGNIRMLAMGDEARPARPDEIQKMCHMVSRAMLDGARGLSTGLTYVPAMYADRAELTALAEIVGQHGGYFAPTSATMVKGRSPPMRRQLK